MNKINNNSNPTNRATYTRTPYPSGSSTPPGPRGKALMSNFYIISKL